MQNETTYSGTLGELERFQTSMEASVSQIPHLEAGRVLLGQKLSQTQDLAKQQAAVTATKQDLSQQLKVAINDARLLATVLRKGVKQHFGSRSEKLAEFGLRPFRGRKSKPAPQPAPETPPAPQTPHTT
jgi:multidrug efflux pump subunit AcrA (membrane-fusion protein)